MIEWGSFVSHSGLQLPFKINLDEWTPANWAGAAEIVRSKFTFSRAVAVSATKGGIDNGRRFADALQPYCVHGYSTLIVDDVLTTGASMEELRRRISASRLAADTVGVVIFARGPVPHWIWPIFVLQDWARCRGAGAG